MSETTNRKCVDARERQARDRLLRHYQKIGAPAIAAALDAAIGAEKRPRAEKDVGERQGALPSLLHLSDDHAA